MPRDNLNLFTPEDILAIRQAFDERTLDVRRWADDKRCGLETIRRIARRETYRHIGERELAMKVDGPSEEEIAASFKRFTEAANASPPQAPEINALLDGMRRKGAES